MSGETAEIVLGSHGLTVSPGTAHDKQVTSLYRGNAVVLDEDVTGLTDGSDDVVELFFVIGMGDVLHAVESTVEGRSDEVIHTGIDDSELFVLAAFDIEHACDEVAALGDDRASEFAMELLVWTQLQMFAPSSEVSLEIRNREVVGVFVENA